MTILPYSINKRELWNKFVAESKQATFLLDRNFMDYHADRFFDCSLLIYNGDVAETDVSDDALLALFPANWVEEERTVYSHQGLTYGGLVTKNGITQVEVLRIMQKVLMYYESYLGARSLLYKPIPYIYCRIPSQEDLYAMFRAGGHLESRGVATVLCVLNPLNMRSLRVRQARKALENGFYIERMNDGDEECLREYWAVLEEVLRVYHNTKPVHTVEEMALLMRRFPRQIKLYVVRSSEAKVVAGTVVFETELVAHVQYIASKAEGRKYGALDLLLRHLCGERYKDKDYVDFGISTERGGYYLNEGLIFQKEGFGGRSVCYDAYRVELERPRLMAMVQQENAEEAVSHVPFLDLKAITESFEPYLSQSLQRVISSGRYILGEENAAWEKEWGEYLGAKHTVLCANGLDALKVILRAYRMLRGWSEGDEVIVPANTFIATILSVVEAGLRPVLVEPDLHDYTIHAEKCRRVLTPRTRCLLPVHLYGRVCPDMEALLQFAEENDLVVVEDAAQAHGAVWHGKRAGTLGDAAGFSFYPGKNLGALGDAGCVVTHDEELARVVRQMVNYGSREKYENVVLGGNSRTDELQAAALRVKLPRLDVDNDRRRAVAKRYIDGIKNPMVVLPEMPQQETECVWHIFPVRCAKRDKLQEYLASHGVQTLIHYPIPPHKQEALSQLSLGVFPITQRIHNEELSLPMSPLLSMREVDYVIELINKFI